MIRYKIVGLHRDGVLAWTVTTNIESEERTKELIAKKEEEVANGTSENYLKDCILVGLWFEINSSGNDGRIVTGPDALMGKGLVESLDWIKNNKDVVEVEMMGICPVCYYKKKHGEF